MVALKKHMLVPSSEKKHHSSILYVNKNAYFIKNEAIELKTHSHMYIH